MKSSGKLTPPEPGNGSKHSGGKRLREVDQAKNDATGRASDVGRQLAFAGIATIWLLRSEKAAQPFDSKPLLMALIILALALLVDFLQYVHCSFVWRRFYNREFNKHKSDDVCVDIPDSLSASTYYFFWTKIVLLLLGYVFLLSGAVVKLRLF